jgi:ABC-type transport system involved in multi-copper enzyme maturation permease subunit
MIPLHGILLAARHAARSCMRGKRLFALLTLVSLPGLLTIATRVFESSTMSTNEFHGVILMLVFLFTIPFSALLLGVGVLGDELEGRTVTYLWTRPVGRGWTYLGRYLGAGVGYALLFVPAMFIALHAQSPAESLGDVSLWRPIAIGLGGFFVYLAFFALLRTVLKRALVAGMFYTLVVDLAVSRMPAVGAAKLSVWHHLMVIHCSAFDMGSARVTARLARTIAPGETLTTSAVALASIGLFCLGLGMWMARTREYPVAGAVA